MVTLVGDKELEVKFHVAQPAEIERRLVAAGAVLLHPRTHEYNLRFDSPNGVLGEAHSMLRLRRDSSSHMTFKGPSTTLGGVLARQEIEFDVSNFTQAQKLIEALGFGSKFMYEKYRTTYVMTGLKITLDEMPYGTFVEIEGTEPEPIQAAAHQLGLNWERRLPETYLSIFRRLKDLYGMRFTDLSFENFNGVEVSLERAGILPADG
ncbi:MAG TPA: class IV adenylate cyclase [Anaerolineales bacterium]|nr:class IV adenylate cyclase [Anaerolineales bacterium]HRQ93212.1 class IV adenylate cyclase [Anaerolineales bacterium]